MTLTQESVAGEYAKSCLAGKREGCMLCECLKDSPMMPAECVRGKPGRGVVQANACSD